jgi:hypothetical protein
MLGIDHPHGRFGRYDDAVSGEWKRLESHLHTVFLPRRHADGVHRPESQQRSVHQRRTGSIRRKVSDRARARLIRSVSRRLERLEARAVVASKKWSFSARILLVHPEKGLTGALLLETGKPTMHVDPTPEEVEEVRADLERRRVDRK